MFRKVGLAEVGGKERVGSCGKRNIDFRKRAPLWEGEERSKLSEGGESLCRGEVLARAVLRELSVLQAHHGEEQQQTGPRGAGRPGPEHRVQRAGAKAVV